VIEHSIAWFHQFKRLRIRWEHRTDIHEAFLKLATCLICWRYLEPSSVRRSIMKGILGVGLTVSSVELKARCHRQGGWRRLARGRSRTSA
jgi:hypothetical protein